MAVASVITDELEVDCVSLGDRDVLGRKPVLAGIIGGPVDGDVPRLEPLIYGREC